MKRSALGPRSSLCGLIVVVMMTGCSDRSLEPVKVPPAVVQVATPLVRKVTDYEIFTATTEATKSVNVTPRVTGYLKEIFFKDGSMVKAEQVLYQIDDRPYKAALDEAKANLEVAKATLVKAQADYDIGMRVKKQNPGAISEQEIVKRLGERDQAKGAIDQAKANLMNAQLNYDWCKVTAPISGRIDRHLVDAGNLVNKDITTLTNIVSLSPIWAYFDVDENTATRYQRLVAEGRVKSPIASQIPVSMGLNIDKGYPFDGVIDFVSNQLDPDTGSIRLRAEFPNKDNQLYAGMFGRVRVPTSSPHQALLVADSAIGVDQGQNFVYVVNDKNEVEYRAVETGQLHSGLREVYSTRKIPDTDANGKDITREVTVLSPDDRVIITGLQRVRPGHQVEAKQIDMLTQLPVEKEKQNSK